MGAQGMLREVLGVSSYTVAIAVGILVGVGVSLVSARRDALSVGRTIALLGFLILIAFLRRPRPERGRGICGSWMVVIGSSAETRRPRTRCGWQASARRHHRERGNGDLEKHERRNGTHQCLD